MLEYLQHSGFKQLVESLSLDKNEKAGEQMADDKDPSEQLNYVISPFDAIRHMDGEREFWRARELSKILGYNRWENFENVIAKAKIA